MLFDVTGLFFFPFNVLDGMQVLVPWTLYMTQNLCQVLFLWFLTIQKIGIGFYQQAWSWEPEVLSMWKELAVSNLKKIAATLICCS